MTVRNQGKIQRKEPAATVDMLDTSQGHEPTKALPKAQAEHIKSLQQLVRPEPPKPTYKSFAYAPAEIPPTNLSVSLPDSVLMRLLEVVVEEIVQVDHLRQQELHPLTKWPRQMPLFRDYLF